MKQGCIYRIDIGQNYYYGQTINPKEREKQHLRQLSSNAHWNIYMQRQFDKCNEFSFTVVAVILDIGQMDDIEQHFLDANFDNKECMNISRSAKWPPSIRGRKFSAEHKAKIGKAHLGREVSVETRAKLSLAHRGRKASAETKAKMSAAQKVRKSPSAETKVKMSAAQKGRTISEGGKESISKKNSRSCYGRPIGSTEWVKFDSRKLAALRVSGSEHCVINCIKNRQHSHLGWEFIGDLSEKSSAETLQSSKRPCRGRQVGLKEWVIFHSRREAAKHIDGCEACVSGCIRDKQKTHKGWEFIDEVKGAIK